MFDSKKHRQFRFDQCRQIIESDLTIRAWCKKHNVGESTMHKWLHLYRTQIAKDSQQSPWIEIDTSNLKQEVVSKQADATLKTTNKASCSTHPPIHIHFNQFDIEVDHDTTKRDIETVLEVIAHL